MSKQNEALRVLQALLPDVDWDWVHGGHWKGFIGPYIIEIEVPGESTQWIVQLRYRVHTDPPKPETITHGLHPAEAHLWEIQGPNLGELVRAIRHEIESAGDVVNTALKPAATPRKLDLKAGTKGVAKVVEGLLQRPDMALAVLQGLETHTFLEPWMEVGPQAVVRQEVADPRGEYVLSVQPMGRPPAWSVTLFRESQGGRLWDDFDEAVEFADRLAVERGFLLLSEAPREPPTRRVLGAWWKVDEVQWVRRRVHPPKPDDGTGEIYAQITENNPGVYYWRVWPNSLDEPAVVGVERSKKSEDIARVLSNAQKKCDNALRDAGWELL